jgi:hypothetical protein
MIRKIIILGLILLCASIFYKRFMAPVLGPFFKEKEGKVDLLQLKVREPKTE